MRFRLISLALVATTTLTAQMASVLSVPTDEQIEHYVTSVMEGRMRERSLTLNEAGGFTFGPAWRVDVYSPLGWITHQAAEAKRMIKPFTLTDVSAEMRAPVLRVVAHPRTPTEVTAQGTRFASSVEHVVLKGVGKNAPAVQPQGMEAFDVPVQNAMGASLVYKGLRASFPLDAVQRIRNDKGEFEIVIVGEGYQKITFRVKTKHFADLP